MLRSLNELAGYKVIATDGDAGSVADFFFEDENWAISDVVIDTGKVFRGRKVLISPEKVGKPDGKNMQFPVNITKTVVRDSAGVSTKVPISQQKGEEGQSTPPVSPQNPHLRSADEVTEYAIQATDGEIGHVEDFIVEDDSWKIRYLVVDTRKWLMGKKVLIGTDWFDRIDWSESKFYLDHKREDIKNCPEYDPNEPINRKTEEILYDYHGRPHYWS